jgi:hypothetical protein
MKFIIETYNYDDDLGGSVSVLIPVEYSNFKKLEHDLNSILDAEIVKYNNREQDNKETASSVYDRKFTINKTKMRFGSFLEIKSRRITKSYFKMYTLIDY